MFHKLKIKTIDMRRLPVYILIDTSGSMFGEPIEAVKVGLNDMVATLRQDPYALETVWVSIITFDREVKQVVPLTALEDLSIPDIKTPQSGPTHTGAALKMMREKYRQEVRLGNAQQKGDWLPLLFILTDGKPSDIQNYNSEVKLITQLPFSNIVACAAGPKALIEPLKQLTNNVFSLDTMDANSFKSYFKWVSQQVSLGGKSVGTVDTNDSTANALPPPPTEVNIVT